MITAEWCRDLAWRHKLDAEAKASAGYDLLEAHELNLAAALIIAARVLDEGAVDAVARAYFAEFCRSNGLEPNWGRSTVEQPRGYKTEIAVHHAAARAVLACLKGEVE